MSKVCLLLGLKNENEEWVYKEISMEIEYFSQIKKWGVWISFLRDR